MNHIDKQRELSTDEKRKIVFVTDLTLWSMGKMRGGPAFAKTIEYYDKDYEVFLVSDEQSNGGYPLLDQTHNIVLKKSIFSRFGNIRFVGFIFRIINHIIVTNRMCKVIDELANSLEIDLLYAYEVFGVKACRKLSRKLHIPFVTRFQGTILSQYKSNIISRLRLYPHFQALKEKSDFVIITDDGTQGDKVLDSLNNDARRMFARNGLDLMEPNLLAKVSDKDAVSLRKRYLVGDDENLFLTVSRLVGWKKVNRAISGFNDYIQYGGNGRLIIVGDGEARTELENMVEKYNLKSKVIFAGAVEHDDVYLYMKAADIFLSLYDLSNVGNPLLEAMTLGKAIITLNVGDTNRIIENGVNGVLLEMSNLDDLGQIMLELSNDKEKRLLLGNSAAKYAKDHFYGWDERMTAEGKIVDSILQTYAEGS